MLAESADGDRQVVRMRLLESLFEGALRARVCVNGKPVRLVEGETIDDLVTPSSVAGIEAYPNISKPGRFAHMGRHPCGAMVILTGYAGGGAGVGADVLRSRPRGRPVLAIPTDALRGPGGSPRGPALSSASGEHTTVTVHLPLVAARA